MSELANNNHLLLGMGQFFAIVGIVGTAAWTNYRNMVERRKTSRKLAEMQEQTKELKNNHGSSARDAIDRIEGKVDDHIKMILQSIDATKSVGHQVGELRRDLASHADRISNVERSAGRNRDSIERISARFDKLNDELH